MKALSIFEVLIVMGIFSIMVVITFPYSLSLLNRDRGNAEMKQLAYIVFHEQQDAYGGLNSKSYGVAFFNDHYVVYTGTSLATAENQDSYYYQTPIRMSQIALSSGNEINFSSGTFRPSQFGTVTLTDARSSFRFEITSEGLITYRPL